MALALAALVVLYGVVGKLDNEAQTKATKAEQCANKLRHPHRKRNGMHSTDDKALQQDKRRQGEVRTIEPDYNPEIHEIRKRNTPCPHPSSS